MSRQTITITITVDSSHGRLSAEVLDKLAARELSGLADSLTIGKRSLSHSYYWTGARLAGHKMIIHVNPPGE